MKEIKHSLRYIEDISGVCDLESRREKEAVRNEISMD